ncbi:MAG: NAD(P)/FAD-dependent oxidoreductase, partial [Spirochaetales bacterium]|nr:NAD(P)/FAD-dependent oxidoreductase [Spirochaetales bacterium]
MKGTGRRPIVIIVGSGMAGLTAAAYLARGGCDVTIFEKSSLTGGLVQSFGRGGFLFDAGPRAIGNAGIVKPMAEDLGLDVRFLKSPVSTGIAGHIVHYETLKDADRFSASLAALFPGSLAEVARIAKRIRTYTRMMASLNKVENPYFKDLPRDPGYLFTKLIPWLPAFLSILIRTGGAHKPIEDELKRLSSNSSLNDMVSQHFFKGTPREFALGYFFNYLDYMYPEGGTGRLPGALWAKAREYGASIRLNTEVVGIDPSSLTVFDGEGKAHSCDALLWAADGKSLYRCVEQNTVPGRFRSRLIDRKRLYASAGTAESVYSLFAAVDLPPEFFKRVSHGHFIYTPDSKGLGELHRSVLKQLKNSFQSTSREDLWSWLDGFCRNNSYEISIPVLKDGSLAPDGKTGIIVSLLFDGELALLIKERGWHKEFKE